MIKHVTAAVAASFLCAGAAAAQSCGGQYVVAPGDTLSGIADRLYKDTSKWSAVYQSNISTIGDDPARIFVGMRLNLTCIDGLPTGLAGGIDPTIVTRAATTPLSIPLGNAANRRKLQLLTADDYAPFTDRDLPNGGLYTEIVDALMDAADPAEGYAINWVNDWSSHLEPLLSNALLDMGFPWSQPDCEAEPNAYRCENLVFSDPVFEMLMLMFVNADEPWGFYTDADMQGRTLCRPDGYATFAFEKDGRNWLTNDVITLATAPTPGDCYELLAEGKVDGVVMNEFTGRQKVKEMGLADQITVADGQPISIDGLYVIAHKSHPEADDLMAVVNEGLATIKANGEYQRIIDEHMTRIWANF
ncbi:MAG: transporter substrate-binding domain-containing protein [Shimia sp.]